jgi:hypothetical protein
MARPESQATGIGKNLFWSQSAVMLVIRRMVDRRSSATAIFLPGEPPRIFPTSDHEHARILQIYKQDCRHQDVLNDFTEYDLAGDKPPPSLRPRRSAVRHRPFTTA